MASIYDIDSRALQREQNRNGRFGFPDLTMGLPFIGSIERILGVPEWYKPEDSLRRDHFAQVRRDGITGSTSIYFRAKSSEELATIRAQVVKDLESQLRIQRAYDSMLRLIERTDSTVYDTN